MEILSPFHYLPIADSSADVSTLLSALAKQMGGDEGLSPNLNRDRLKKPGVLFP